MNLKAKALIFLFAALIFFIFQKDIALAGFGISPASVTNKNLVPGSFYEEDIFLVQGSPDADLNAVVTIDAGKINSWIKIENGNSFVIPKGVQQFPMKVVVSVPLDAELGKYNGAINVNTSPTASQKSGVSVVLGANIAINLEVTSVQISDFSIQNFQIPDVVKESPIKFIIKVKNDGNIDNGPTKVSLTFFDQHHSKQLGQQEKSITEKVKSFQTKDISVELSNNLDAGSYWADVKIYAGDKVAVDSKIVFAVIGPPAGQKVSIFSDFFKMSVWVYLLIILVVLILSAVVVLILHRNKKQIFK